MRAHPPHDEPRLPPANPFAARCVRPGALPFLASADLVPRLADRVLAETGPFQVVGPHGSGKTSLLLALQHELEQRGYPVADRLPRRRHESPSVAPPVCLLLDGTERWSRGRWLLQSRRLRRPRVVFSLHRSRGWRTLWRLATDLRTVQELARRLQRNHPRLVREEDVTAVYARRAPNVRELWFELYDLYGSRQHESQGHPSFAGFPAFSPIADARVQRRG